VNPLRCRLPVTVKEPRRTASSRGSRRCLQFMASCHGSLATLRCRPHRRNRPPRRTSHHLQAPKVDLVASAKFASCALCFVATRASNRAALLEIAFSPASSPCAAARRRPTADARAGRLPWPLDLDLMDQIRSPSGQTSQGPINPAFAR
jgi:hypothetical protein